MSVARESIPVHVLRNLLENMPYDTFFAVQCRHGEEAARGLIGLPEHIRKHEIWRMDRQAAAEAEKARAGRMVTLDKNYLVDQVVAV